MQFDDTTLSPAIRLLVLVTVVLSFVFGILRGRNPSLRLSVMNRWARWLGVSMGLAYLIFQAGWFARPFWVLAVVIFLVWLLLETLYTWFAIKALSQSGLSLFPKFSENQQGEDWPIQRPLIEMKDWLRGKGFSRRQALLASLDAGIEIKSTVFESEDKLIRFQIIFLPQSNGDISYCCAFSSESVSGERFITDNVFMPFGGFYPTNWKVVRKPWCRSVPRLYKTHRGRVAKQKLVPYEGEPAEDLNAQQRLLEKTNIDQGFLVPPHLHDELGRITWEGRYRVWKEVWLLNYFGVPSRS